MTPTEGFEAWWKQQLPDTPIPGGATPIVLAWLAACQFQRERDAKLVEHHVNGPGPLRTQLATAIREGG